MAAPATLIEGFEVLVRARNSTGIFLRECCHAKECRCRKCRRLRWRDATARPGARVCQCHPISCFHDPDLLFKITCHQAPGKLRANTIVR